MGILSAVARRSLRAIRRAWPALLAVSLSAALAGGLADAAAASLARLLVPAEARWLVHALPGHAYSLLGIELAFIQTLAEALAFALGFGAAALVTAAADDGRRLTARTGLALGTGLVPRLTVAYLAIGGVAIALAVVSVPLLILAPLGVLVALAGVFLWWWRPSQRPLARWLIVLGLPFGLLVDGVVRLTVALPAIAVEGEGVLAGLRTSRRLVRGRWWAAALAVLLTAVAGVALTSAAGLIIGLLAALAHHSAPHSLVWGSWLLLAVSVALSQLPSVTLTALYLVLRELPPPAPAPVAPAPARGRPRPAIAGGVSLLLVGLLLGAAAPASAASVATTASAPRSAAASSARSASPGSLPAQPKRSTITGPAFFTVTNLNDGGAGSLRDAVAQAGTVTSGGSTITFGVSGTITLASTIALSSQLTLDGSGQSVTVSGAGAVPVFTGGPFPVNIRNLTIAHGHAAAASGAAGGFTAGEGVPTFTNDTFDSNDGDTAGALYLSSGTVTGSTFVSNHTNNSGGGGLTVVGTATASNDTFVNNSAPSLTNSMGQVIAGGGIYVGGLLTGNGLTVVGSTNGGIVWINAISFTLDNSLLEGNGNGDCFGFGAPAGAGNVDSNSPPSCGGLGGMNAGMVSGLAGHGGPTETVSLLPGAVAIGAGDPATCLSSDQRGKPRANPCDAGAYEFQPAVGVSLVSDQPSYHLGDPVTMTATVTPLDESAAVNGSVSFYDGSTLLGSATLGTPNSDQAIFSDSSLGLGAHSLTARYAGQSNGYGAGTSAAVAVTVNPALTQAAVVSSLNPATVGSSVTFTATVTSALGGTPTGTVTFLDGLSSLATVSLTNGSAAYVTSSLAVGHHSITVQYSGDAGHGTATSLALDQDIRDVSSTLASASTPAVYGTASVSVQVTSPTGTPSGIVACSYGANSYVTGLDGSGRATCAWPGFAAAPGSGSVTVAYQGDDGHAPSSASAPLTVTAAATSQSLAADLASPVFGQRVTLTATVSASGTPAVPTGSVDFKAGAVTFATVALNGSGGASTQVTPPLGATTYTAVYHPGVGFAAAADATHTITVSAAPTTTALQLSSTSALTGQPVTLTATVSVGGGSPATAAGSIAFADGASALATIALSAGTAAYTTAGLGVGGHTLTATFVPAAGFLASAAAGQALTVAAAGTTTTLAAAPASPAAYGQAVTLTATVSVTSPGGGSPAGNIEFFDGSTDLGGATLSGASAVFILILPAAGSHTWSATYAGGGGYNGSASAALRYTVAAEATQLSASSSGTLLYGSPVTLSAHVSSFDGVAVSGPVNFTALPSGVVLGSANLDASGNASLISSFIPGDSNQVLVLFPGDARFQASGQTLSLVMQKATPSLRLAASPDPSVVFGTVTLHVAVIGVSGGSLPQGFVTPYVDGSSLGMSLGLDAAGSAAFTITTPAAGAHSLSASYSGNRDYAAVSLPSFVPFTVNPADPGLTLAASPDPAGQSVPFTLTAQVAAQGGQTPQGSVNFLTGSNVLLGSAAVDASGKAALTTSWPQAGNLTVVARFASSDGVFANASASITLPVGQLATTTIVGVNSTPPWLAGVPVNLTAFVSAAAPVSGGTVAFYDGSTLLGVALLSGGSAGVSASLPDGSRQIKANYSGATGFAGSAGATTLPITAHPVNVTLTLGSSAPKVGQADLVTMLVTAADGFTGAIPAGSLTLTDGSQTCSSSASAGSSCVFNWSTPGARTITASSAGDSYFAAGSATASVAVERLDAGLSATTDYGARWIATDKLKVYWSLLASSPAPTGSVSVLNGLSQGCINQPLGGNCLVPIPAAGSQTITVSYSGDASYLPSTFVLTNVALACHYFSANASPSDFGVLNVYPQPDCQNGYGYADGDQVLIVPQPGLHHRFLNYDGYPPSTDLLNLTITQDTVIIGRFDWLCDQVAVRIVAHANWFPARDPDCGLITQNAFDVFLPYHDGESVTFKGSPFTDPVLGPFSIGGWTASYPVPSATGPDITFTVAPGEELIPQVARPCYKLSVTSNPSVGGGLSAAVINPPTGSACSLPGGATGYTYATQLRVVVQEHISGAYPTLANPTYNFAGIAGSGTDGTAFLLRQAGPFLAWTMTMHGDDSISLAFTQCHQVSVQTDPNLVFPLGGGTAFAPGSVNVAGSACHDANGNAVPGWYAGPVTLTASAATGFQLYSWQGDVGSGVSPVLGPGTAPATVTLDGKADHDIRAAFGHPATCFPVPLELGAGSFNLTTAEAGWAGAVPTSPYGSIRVDASTPELPYSVLHPGSGAIDRGAGSGHGYCPSGEYEAGSAIFIDINPTVPGIVAGVMSRSIRLNPDGTLNNYSASTAGPLGGDGALFNGAGPLPSQLGVILPGAGQAQAYQVWFCYPVAVGEYARLSTGDVFDPALTMVGFGLESGTACPILPTTYLPGSTVKASATASPGYTFDHWEGSVSGTAATITPAVNGPLTLTAAFKGNCYKLSVDDQYSSGNTSPDDSIRSDTPNCPGALGGQGYYIAGTVVALQAADKSNSGEPFEGWSGADNGSGPLGIVTMNADKSLHALYDDSSVNPTANATNFGNYLATVGKATVGVIATGITDYVFNFTSVGLLGLVGTIGGDLGIPGVQTFMTDLADTITGPMDCIGTWGLSNGGANGLANGNSATQGAGYGVSAAGGAASVAQAAGGQGALGKVLSLSSSFRQFSQANAGAISDAQKTTYALKWVALGVQLGAQLTTASFNNDWSLSSFDSQMQSCLAARADSLASST